MLLGPFLMPTPLKAQEFTTKTSYPNDRQASYNKITSQ